MCCNSTGATFRRLEINILWQPNSTPEMISAKRREIRENTANNTSAESKKQLNCEKSESPADFAPKNKLPICKSHLWRMSPASYRWVAQLSITIKWSTSIAWLPWFVVACPASPKKLRKHIESDTPSTLFAYNTPSKPHNRFSVTSPPFMLPKITSTDGCLLKAWPYTGLPVPTLIPASSKNLSFSGGQELITSRKCWQ